MIRERIEHGLQQARREELLEINGNIHDLQQRREHIDRELVKAKSSRNDLLKAINERVTDKQISDLLTDVMVGQGVISDDSPEWLEDSDLETDA